MKIIRIILAIVIAALIGRGYYEMATAVDRQTLMGIVTGVEIAIALCGIMCLSGSRSATVARVVCSIYLTVALITNGIFLPFEFSTAVYLIVNGLLTALFTLIAILVLQAKQ